MRYTAYHALRRALSSIGGHAGERINRRVTLRTLRGQYERGEPISMVTAYDYPSAVHVDEAGVDVALVGDSLGMVVLGARTTQGVTMTDMIHHTRAVRRGVSRALVVADLPFGSYELDPKQAAESAIKLVKETGVDAVKIEGGREKSVRAICDAGVAVMGHVGLSPQSYSALGGFRAIGTNASEAAEVLDDALAVQDAGAFAIVVECVPAKVAAAVTHALDVPTIGIGAGLGCNGQVLVYHDLLGIHRDGSSPRFAKRYAEIGDSIHKALQEFNEQVRMKIFPATENSQYTIEMCEFDKFLKDTACKRLSTRRVSSPQKSEEDGFKIY